VRLLRNIGLFVVFLALVAGIIAAAYMAGFILASAGYASGWTTT